MTTGSTSYIRESFVEDLLRMSMPQSKVAVRLRLDVLCGVHQKRVNTI